jgi:transcriptional regulator with XRE-family HTH domain
MISNTITKLKYFRERQLQLTQMQFAALVGMGVATINRYERGTEPTEAHRQLLEGLSHPENLLRLLKGKERELGKETYHRLISYTQLLTTNANLARVESTQRRNSDQLLNGKREFELQRLIEMIRFFTRQGEWKTKLNKLLFYSDFFAFRELGKSLTGTCYVVGTHGPIPDGQETLYAALIEAGIVEPREEFVAITGQPVEKLFSRLDVNLRIFSLKERHILERIRYFFVKMNAREIANYSHDESAYQGHNLGEQIPYSEALGLKPISSPESLPEQATESLVAVAKRFNDQVPAEELAKLPADASDNLDHYLYGHSKRKK